MAHNAHGLHLSQDPPQAIQGYVGFKVQVLCSLENLNGVQRPTQLPDFLRSKEQQQTPGGSLEPTACAVCFPLALSQTREDSAASHWSQVSIQLSHTGFLISPLS